jgi:hypothetical protein
VGWGGEMGVAVGIEAFIAMETEHISS